MRRSQRLLQKLDSTRAECSNLSGKCETTRTRANFTKNEIYVGSSHLQQKVNADSSSHSINILAGLGSEILSEQLPPHQETSVLTDIERGTNSNSATLIGNRHKQPLLISGPSKCMTGLKRKASCSAPKKQGGGKITKSTRERRKSWSSMFVAATNLPGEAATSTSAESIADQTSIGVDPTTTLAANANTKRNGRPTKANAASKSQRKRKPREPAKWTLPPNFENPVTELKLKAPLRLADFRDKLKVQPMESGGGPYYDNAVDPRFMSLNSVRDSLLPKIYPPHFVDQLPPEAVTSAPWHSNVAASCLTPELTQPNDLELADSVSATSLPESLCTFFEADDIREILNVGKALYHLNVQHLQVLAIVLNLEFDYLLSIIEKVLKLDSYRLETIDRAFRRSARCGAAAQNGESDSFSSGSSIIGCSQSPVKLRHFPLHS